jgi:hypothetical protein
MSADETEPPQAQWTEGGEGLELDPPLELIEPEDITLDVMQRGCLLLGIDADDVLAGRDVELPEHPPLATAQLFFDLAVENSEAYDLKEMQYGRARALLGVVAEHFINAPAER